MFTVEEMNAMEAVEETVVEVENDNAMSSGCGWG